MKVYRLGNSYYWIEQDWYGRYICYEGISILDNKWIIKKENNYGKPKKNSNS